MTALQLTLDDDTEINVHDPAEVVRYSEELGTTELELRDAVHAVGPQLAELRRVVGDTEIPLSADHYYDDLPAEEGAMMWERECAPGPRPE